MPENPDAEQLEELRQRLVASTGEHPAVFGAAEVASLLCGLDIAEREKAALAEAAIQPRPNGHKWCALCGMWARKDQEIDHTRTCVLADLSPAAKELLEKAQAHDAMVAENERLRAALHRPQCPSTKAVEIEDGVSETYPSRRGRCSVCDYKGPVNNSGNLWRHSSQAALAGETK